MCVISPFSKAQKAIKSDVIIHSHLHNKNTKLFHVKLCHINFLLMSVPWLSLTIFTRYEFNSGTNLPQIIISCAFQWIFSVCNLPHFRKYFTFQKIFMMWYLLSLLSKVMLHLIYQYSYFYCTFNHINHINYFIISIDTLGIKCRKNKLSYKRSII